MEYLKIHVRVTGVTLDLLNLEYLIYLKFVRIYVSNWNNLRFARMIAGQGEAYTDYVATRYLESAFKSALPLS